MNKVPASAGAQWILDAFAAFRAHPLPYLLVAVVYAAGVLVATMLLKSAPALGMLLLLVLTLMQPVFLAALLLGAHDAHEGRVPGNDLLRRVPATGKLGQLLLTLLPQIIAGILSGILLYVMVGAANLEKTLQVMEAIQADPQSQAELMKQLPLAAFGRWAMTSLILGIVSAMFAFLAIPQILFNGRRAMEALGDSFKAVTGNLGAAILGFAFFVITVMAILFAFIIVSGLVSLMVGRDTADLVGSFLQILVLLPLQGLITYAAWRSIFGATVPQDDARLPNQFQA